MIPDPILANKIAHWRAKQAAGEMTIDEWKVVFADLRASRSSAQAASNASKAKGGTRAKRAAKPTASAADLKAGLMALKKI